MTNFREERTKWVDILVSLKEKQEESRTPEVYVGTIKKIRRELLGMYQTVLNTRKHVDSLHNPPPAV